MRFSRLFWVVLFVVLVVAIASGREPMSTIALWILGLVVTIFVAALLGMYVYIKRSEKHQAATHRLRALARSAAYEEESRELTGF